MIFGFLTPGPYQLIILAIIVLLLFGKRLPDTMRSLGRSITEFKKGVKEGEDEIAEDRNLDEQDKHAE
ncbi:twin arginine translocase protein A [Maioricimonas rarisocia]|uniref:Sec-independent protein translocase protein TatA n=1 Tax=Maioricimonas rarisocia TaxID=2528026 RepID=A0A517Z8N8_9PLAN|nr:twin-arginine translocase TatA/TatE family subunit [Maioricimonas rarisocia]QDU38835.1 twin arginine translocase protein A [Maioricimonas rarisocia]